VNLSLLTGATYTDLPAVDGTYSYRLSTVSSADNESELSEEIAAQSDRTPPKATEIGYGPLPDPLLGGEGSSPPLGGEGSGERFPPGTVNVLLTVSESLSVTPFLSITPEQGLPFSITLTKVADRMYAGSFTITDATPSGTAHAVFSARDVVGNRGTEIDQGRTFMIDTDGPAITRLVIQPGQPIRNDQTAPVAVTVAIGLNEAVKPSEAPSLAYELSGTGRLPAPVANLVAVTRQSGEAQAWQGSFTLPADAGLNAVELLQFVYQGQDDLGNLSDQILCASGDDCGPFQVYQGDLPALAIPSGLTGKALLGGKITLTWNPIAEAAGYRLYRQAPGEQALTLYQELGSGVEYVDGADSALLDGDYTYALASVRQANGTETFSALSAPVTVTSDATPPAAPQSLALTPVPQGIYVQWADPLNLEPVSYRLYRASGTAITSVAGLTPVIPNVPAQYLATGVVDPNPSPTTPCYALTAVDDLGNKSAPSNSAYYNVGLLPVSDLLVRQQDQQAPVVSWNHPSAGSVAGYDMYLGAAGQEVKLNPARLTDRAYTDTGYAGDERRYTVIAVDANSVPSMGHSITFPVLKATLAAGTKIKRGLMNHVEYRVENLSPGRVTNAQLQVQVGGKTHISQTCALETGASQMIPVVIGGYPDLPALAPVTTTIAITPNAGELVEIVRTSQIEVGDGMFVLQILNEEFTRGVSGAVRFTLENTSAEEIEIITAAGAGNSPEIRYELRDQDGNVLSSAPFKQMLGQDLVTLANGNTVARIPAGAIFPSDPTTLPVPGNVPNTVHIGLTIDHLYYHAGRPDQVMLNKLRATHQLALIDTAYSGEVVTITPATSNGGEDIHMTVRAVERATQQPLAGVPLDLVISVSGFDRSYQIVTGSDGTFTYTFTPLSGESGLYTVRAVHPALLDRPVQGTFVITRVSVSPSTINLDLPQNYEKSLSFQVTTGEGTELHNLHLEYAAADQPGGVFPQGVHVTLGAPIFPSGARVGSLPAASTATLPLTIWADNSAAATGKMSLRIVSAENRAAGWKTVVINTHFSEPAPPQPDLIVSPDYVETGVAYNDQVTETVTLKNQGTADLHTVSLTLLADQSGAPAPAWISLNSPATLDVIPVGAQREVRVQFQPTTAVLEGRHTAYLRIASPEAPTVDLGLYATVTQSGRGKVVFKVADIYTGTLNAQGQLIQGLEGARIKIQNEAVPSIEGAQTTDPIGEILFEDVPAGRYKYRITADNHQEAAGRFWIKPGLTTT